MRKEPFAGLVSSFPLSRRCQRLLTVAVLALSGFFLLLFVYTVARRIAYPYDLEWAESNNLVAMVRIVHGQGVYVQPSLDFIPYLYAPVFLYLGALFHHFLPGYVGPRLLSTLATLGCCAVIYGLVRDEVRPRVAAVAAAGLFIATYAASGTFMDIARVDSVFVFFLLLALLAQRRGYPVLAALLWVVDLQTKQSVLPLALLILAGAGWRRPRQAVIAVGTYVIAAAASILILNHLTHGWYDFYIFTVARGKGIVWRQVVTFWPSGLLAPLAAAWLVIGASVLLARSHWKRESFFLAVSIVLFAGLWFVDAHVGTSANVFMPAYAWIAVLFGTALGHLLESSGEQRDPRNAAVLVTLALGATALQLVTLFYNPGQYIPTAATRAMNDRLVSQLRALPGDVYLLNHTYAGILAGKQPHAEGQALLDVLDAHQGEALRTELNARLAAGRYTAVVVDDIQPTETWLGIDRWYHHAIATPMQGDRFLTSQPQWFLLPCTAAAEELQALETSSALESTQHCPGAALHR